MQNLNNSFATEFNHQQEIEFIKAAHAREIRHLKAYLCDKVDGYLQEKAADFYAALATMTPEQSPEIINEVKQFICENAIHSNR